MKRDDSFGFSSKASELSAKVAESIQFEPRPKSKPKLIQAETRRDIEGFNWDTWGQFKAQVKVQRDSAGELWIEPPPPPTWLRLSPLPTASSGPWGLKQRARVMMILLRHITLYMGNEKAPVIIIQNNVKYFFFSPFLSMTLRSPWSSCELSASLNVRLVCRASLGEALRHQRRLA